MLINPLALVITILYLTYIIYFTLFVDQNKISNIIFPWPLLETSVKSQPVQQTKSWAMDEQHGRVSTSNETPTAA